ncbi:MAG: flagellar protein FlaG [Defluviitaleaceae bacterium]|nr:flagellar protein FlaG [Defluviitaleaceae bacterium]
MDVNTNMNTSQIQTTAQAGQTQGRAVPSPRSLEAAQVAFTRETPNRDYHAPNSVTEPVREEEVNDQMLDSAFAEANNAIPNNAFSLSYGIHEATNRIMVSIHNRETNELIRELPPESRLDTYARISEFVGLLFDSNS